MHTQHELPFFEGNSALFKQGILNVFCWTSSFRPFGVFWCRPLLLCDQPAISSLDLPGLKHWLWSRLRPSKAWLSAEIWILWNVDTAPQVPARAETSRWGWQGSIKADHKMNEIYDRLCMPDAAQQRMTDTRPLIQCAGLWLEVGDAQRSRMGLPRLWRHSRFPARKAQTCRLPARKWLLR